MGNPVLRRWRIDMNAFYNLGIIEGFLSQHENVPENVLAALLFVREVITSPPAVVVKKTKKRAPMSKEWREKNLLQLARMREIRRENLAAKRS
jgi:hypothetical protein